MTSSPVFPVIAALQLPSFTGRRGASMAWYEDFLLSNARSFLENGITAIKVQDETVEPAAAAENTIARMAALGRAFRREFPQAALGIIVQAHDARAPLAIADACDASFVRLKVFAGSAINAEGTRNALGPEAVAYRAALGREDIRIFADVHVRTAWRTAPVPHEMAAAWAARLGADALVLTGSDFRDTGERIERARNAGVRPPILIGGGVTSRNVREALGMADGVVVSTALVRDGAPEDALDRWDAGKIRAFVDAAGDRLSGA